MNKQHLEIAMSGGTGWNEWRSHHPEIRPDLSGASLSGANLRWANLREATLSGADLRGARRLKIGGADERLD